jgi:hypothetical protein
MAENRTRRIRTRLAAVLLVCGAVAFVMTQFHDNSSGAHAEPPKPSKKAPAQSLDAAVPATGTPSPAPAPAPKAAAASASAAAEPEATPVAVPAAQAAAPSPTATASAVPRPPIVKRLIPYGSKRKRDMAAYSKRHYGQNKWRLTAPRLIVEHYAVAGSIGAIYNTFAPNNPDVEYHELPGVCSHFAVGADGTIVKFVRTDVRCRHTVGLNQTSIGIEHVGFSDADVLNRPAQLNASLALTRWLRCQFGIPVKGVIGHNESLSSPYYRELDPRFRGRTHGDWTRADMNVYRGKLNALGAC